MIDTIERIAEQRSEEEIKAVIPLSPAAETSPPPPPSLKGDFKIIPLYEIEAVLNSWHYLQKGVERILEFAGSDTSLAKIYNDIVAGKLLLWIALLDGEYCGFATTRFDNSVFGRKALWIVHTFIKSGLNPDIFMEGFKEMKDYGRQFNCDILQFYTRRSMAFERKLTKLGWETSYTEFIFNLRRQETK